MFLDCSFALVALPAIPQRNGSPLRLKPDRWRLPDIAVEPFSAPRERYAYRATYLNIEVLSEDDTKDKMFEKCRLYHEWGVPYCWVIDGENRRAWECHQDQTPREVREEIGAGDIQLSIQEMFARLYE